MLEGLGVFFENASLGPFLLRETDDATEVGESLMG